MWAKRIHFDHLAMPIVAALLLASGCGTSERVNIKGPLAIASPPEALAIGESLNPAPRQNIEARDSHATNSNTVPIEAQPSLTSLIGRTQLEIQAALGSPQFQRFDVPAQIWQYRQNGCVLYLFLYPSSRGLSVSHLETRDHVYAGNDQHKCFAEILRAARNTHS